VDVFVMQCSTRVFYKDAVDNVNFGLASYVLRYVNQAL
jgi:hypothetical protein